MSKKEEQKREKSKSLSSYAKYSSIAFQMFVIIGIGAFVGVKLDDAFPNKYNAYTIILSLVFVIFAIVFVIRRIIAISKEDN
ncbi:AtpZ/AtpI family protein [Xanthomarina sp. F1114]|uniref:AtpZ/AtpI family protein n=1 Tax=Xanthomarina sp. F1114 TaxID=2996019 RepID=UPI00225DFE4B|nr:AtpZ/AtpI family protein [Xanthomarina sp. F1114]MCX7548813.1 AtpZ/AtpI family protein [Xanthomarina sp. F1114]